MTAPASSPHLAPTTAPALLAVGDVLAALRRLAQQADSPVVRECLETAWADIAFLAGSDAADCAEEAADAEG
jgi:hypothetical protein